MNICRNKWYQIDSPGSFFELIKCHFVDMIMKRDSRYACEERRFASLVLNNITSNPRDLAIAPKLSYLNMSKTGCEVEGNMALAVLCWYGVSFLLLLSLSSRVRVVTTGTS